MVAKTRKPEVSVIMSVYNGKPTLRECIQSVLDQTFKNFEFIIIDDGSTDNTNKILKEFAKKDKRIRVVRQKNQGITKSLIKAAKLAKGKYIAIQGGGDISFPERFEKQLEEFKRTKNAGVIGTGTIRVDENGKKFSEIHPSKITYYDMEKVNYAPLLETGSAMIKKKIYEKTGGFRKEFERSTDQDLWFRTSEISKVGIIPEILYKQILQEKGLSRKYESAKLQDECIMLAILCAKERKKGKKDYVQIYKNRAIENIKISNQELAKFKIKLGARRLSKSKNLQLAREHFISAKGLDEKNILPRVGLFLWFLEAKLNIGFINRLILRLYESFISPLFRKILSI